MNETGLEECADWLRRDRDSWRMLADLSRQRAEATEERERELAEALQNAIPAPYHGRPEPVWLERAREALQRHDKKGIQT